MKMRVFPRDLNLDIMDEFLKDGQFQSIPVAVFYTREHQYIGHWTEHPALADEDRARIREEVTREKPDADDQEIRAEVRVRTQARYPAWQQASVREMREMLAMHLKME